MLRIEAASRRETLGGAAVRSLNSQKNGPWRQVQRVGLRQAAAVRCSLGAGLLGTLGVQEMHVHGGRRGGRERCSRALGRETVLPLGL